MGSQLVWVQLTHEDHSDPGLADLEDKRAEWPEKKDHFRRAGHGARTMVPTAGKVFV